MLVYQYTRASIEHPDRDEDALLILQPEGKAPVFVVIDGMGGHQHVTSGGQRLTGRDAAQMLIDSLTTGLATLPVEVDASPGGAAEQTVIHALQQANLRVNTELNQGEQLHLHERVGAVITVAALCENGKRLLAVQVGDTRGYLFTDSELIQLCHDEDNIEFLIEEGVLNVKDAARITDVLNRYDGVTPPQVEGSIIINGQPFELYIAWRWFLVGNTALGIPPSNIVMKALGIDPEMSSPQISRIEVNVGDTLLLCSDGIYKNLSDEELVAGLQVSGDPAAYLGEAALKRSQDTTNQRRAPDDISALIVRF